MQKYKIVKSVKLFYKKHARILTWLAENNIIFNAFVLEVLTLCESTGVNSLEDLRQVFSGDSLGSTPKMGEGSTPSQTPAVSIFSALENEPEAPESQPESIDNFAPDDFGQGLKF